MFFCLQSKNENISPECSLPKGKAPVQKSNKLTRLYLLDVPCYFLQARRYFQDGNKIGT